MKSFPWQGLIAILGMVIVVLIMALIVAAVIWAHTGDTPITGKIEKLWQEQHTSTTWHKVGSVSYPTTSTYTDDYATVSTDQGNQEVSLSDSDYGVLTVGEVCTFHLTHGGYSRQTVCER